MKMGRLVNCLDIHEDELSGRKQFCDSCVVGKHTRKQFISLESSSGQLELMFVVLFNAERMMFSSMILLIFRRIT